MGKLDVGRQAMKAFQSHVVANGFSQTHHVLQEPTLSKNLSQSRSDLVGKVECSSCGITGSACLKPRQGALHRLDHSGPHAFNESRHLLPQTVSNHRQLGSNDTALFGQEKGFERSQTIVEHLREKQRIHKHDSKRRCRKPSLLIGLPPNASINSLVVVRGQGIVRGLHLLGKGTQVAGLQNTQVSNHVTKDVQQTLGRLMTTVESIE